MNTALDRPFRHNAVAVTDRTCEQALSTKVGPDIFQMFDEMAKRRDRSRSALLRALVKQFVAHPEILPGG